MSEALMSSWRTRARSGATPRSSPSSLCPTRIALTNPRGDERQSGYEAWRPHNLGFELVFKSQPAAKLMTESGVCAHSWHTLARSFLCHHMGVGVSYERGTSVQLAHAHALQRNPALLPLLALPHTNCAHQSTRKWRRDGGSQVMRLGGPIKRIRTSV